MTENMIEKLNAEAKYLQISLPYDKEDHLITFDDGMMTELECDDDFAPPMLNPETLLLEYVIVPLFAPAIPPATLPDAFES